MKRAHLIETNLESGGATSDVDSLSALPPHPGPLPWGEGVPLVGSWIVYQLGTESSEGLARSKAACALTPHPSQSKTWGSFAHSAVDL